MRRYVPLVLLVLALVAGACSGDDDTGSAANTSIPDKTTTSSTTTTQPDTVSPDVIPTDESRIDEAYVEGVLDALFVESLRALILVRDSGDGVVTEEASDLVNAISNKSESVEIQNSLASTARSGFEGIPPEPSPILASVVKVITASRSCVLAEIVLDAAGVTGDPRTPEPDERQFARLAPASASQRDSGLNPTAWVLAGLPVRTDGTVPDAKCQQ